MDSISGFLFSQDPTQKLYAHLRRAIPSEVTVCEHSLPKGWNPTMGAAVVVADGAPQARDTGHDRTLVRVSVHAPTFAIARRLGRSINEYLLSPMGGLGLSISRTRSTGVIVGPDSLKGGYVATCSYSCGTTRKVV